MTVVSLSLNSVVKTDDVANVGLFISKIMPQWFYYALETQCRFIQMSAAQYRSFYVILALVTVR